MGERWTTAQVAEFCGIQPSTYRAYVSQNRAPAALPERDPETGAKLYDADAVRAWADSRPGPGARTDLGQTLGQTPVGEGRDVSASEVSETGDDLAERHQVAGSVAEGREPRNRRSAVSGHTMCVDENQ